MRMISGGGPEDASVPRLYRIEISIDGSRRPGWDRRWILKALVILNHSSFERRHSIRPKTGPQGLTMLISPIQHMCFQAGNGIKRSYTNVLLLALRPPSFGSHL